MILIFNLVNFIFSNSYIILIIDLALKISISFIPHTIVIFWLLKNSKIQHKITSMHFQIMLDQIRTRIIQSYFGFHWIVTDYSMTKMEKDQKNQFKEQLLRRINGEPTDLMKAKVTPTKIYSNSGINCDILTVQLTKNNKQAQEIKQKKQKQNSLHNETFGTIQQSTKDLNKVEKKQKVQKIQKVQKVQKIQELPKFNYKIQKKDQISRGRIQQSKSSFELIGLEQGPISGIKKSQLHRQLKPNLKGQTKIALKHSSKIIDSPDDYKRSYTFTKIKPQSTKQSKPYKQQSEVSGSDVVDNLNLSVSDYSQLFQDQEQDLPECKVEVILEIGMGTSIRLEIYNLQLYANSYLRIVSLYGREFQKHQLKSMVSLPGGYYQLFFNQDKIPSRKIKFRGQYQQFMKYLVKP